MCVECDDGLFSRARQTECERCPSSPAVECLGGKLKVKNGYWWEGESASAPSRRRLLAVNNIWKARLPHMAAPRRALSVFGSSPVSYTPVVIVGSDSNYTATNATQPPVLLSPSAFQEDTRLTGLRTDTTFHKCPSEEACVVQDGTAVCSEGTTG